VLIGAAQIWRRGMGRCAHQYREQRPVVHCRGQVCRYSS
jgi:hypothetical protein